jgi:hypothetical protein
VMQARDLAGKSRSAGSRGRRTGIVAADGMPDGLPFRDGSGEDGAVSGWMKIFLCPFSGPLSWAAILLASEGDVPSSGLRT